MPKKHQSRVSLTYWGPHASEAINFTIDHKARTPHNAQKTNLLLSKTTEVANTANLTRLPGDNILFQDLSACNQDDTFLVQFNGLKLTLSKYYIMIIGAPGPRTPCAHGKNHQGRTLTHNLATGDGKLIVLISTRFLHQCRRTVENLRRPTSKPKDSLGDEGARIKLL